MAPGWGPGPGPHGPPGWYGWGSGWSPAAAERPAGDTLGKVLRTLGAALMIIGGLTAILLIGEGNARSRDAVEKLARIESGCTESLTISSTGTYHVYYERGYDYQVLDLPNSESRPRCEQARGVSPRTVPEFSIRDDAGNEVAVSASDGETYRVDGLDGRVVGTFTADQPATLVVAVGAGAPGTRLAFGLARNSPRSIVVRMTVIGISIGVGLFVIGLALLLWGRSRRPAVSADQSPAGASGWFTYGPTGGWPVYALPPGPPPPAPPGPAPASWPYAQPGAPTPGQPLPPPQYPPR